MAHETTNIGVDRWDPTADDDLDAVADPGELRRFRKNPRNLRTQLRFGRHLLDRVPASMVARLLLGHASDDLADRLEYLAEGVEIGMERWSRELRRPRETDWVGQLPHNLFVVLTSAYADQLGASGRHEEAAELLKFLLQLDPDDRIGAVACAQTRGVAAGAASLVQ